MEKKLMMPANYNVMSEEEMTYTQGGAVEVAWALSTVTSVAFAALTIGNVIWGATTSRKWIQANKGGKDVGQLVTKGVDTYLNYMSSSVWNAIVGVFTGINAVALWPVYAVAWITA